MKYMNMKKYEDGTEGYFFFQPHNENLSWYGVDLYDIDDGYNEGRCYGIPMFSVMHDKFIKVSYNNDTNFKNILDILAQSALNNGCKFKFIDTITYKEMYEDEMQRRKGL